MKCLYTLTLVLLLYPSLAHAYIGPGLGVVAAYSLMGPVAAIIVALAIVLYFPLRYWYKKRKKERAEKEKLKSQKAAETKADDTK